MGIHKELFADLNTINKLSFYGTRIMKHYCLLQLNNNYYV